MIDRSSSDVVDAATGDGAQDAGLRADDRRRPIAPWIALAIAIVLTGLFVVLVNADPNEGGTQVDSPLLGRPAPEAVGTLLDGRGFDLSQRKGSWVVINFFRADCAPCIQEHPDLVDFVDQQQLLGSDGAEFYSVVVNDTRSDVEEFFAKRGGDWPVVIEHDQIDVAFGVALVPETWIIDPSGVVQVRIISKVSTEALNVTMQQLREAYG